MRAPSVPAAEPARIDALDGVRGLAILLVVLFHALWFDAAMVGGQSVAPGSPYARLASLGWCGVDVFFVLSGYLITGILLRSKGQPRYFRNFYARRALRIFPLYYLVLALLLWVLPRPPATAAEQISYLLYYQNVRLAFVPDVRPDLAREITWSMAI
jgi:peptidoglycan/LPS O-acetylase OafA/YrhL